MSSFVCSAFYVPVIWNLRGAERNVPELSPVFSDMLSTIVSCVFLASASAFTAPSFAGSRPLAPARHPEVVAQLFGKKTAAADALPKGWRKVPSRSRPGEFSYENIKTKQVYDKLPVGAFYDDERDTVSKPAWKPPSWNDDEDMTDAERSGFTADGRDLAAAGSEIYYAIVPFLFFAFLYSNGIFSFGYDNGNF